MDQHETTEAQKRKSSNQQLFGIFESWTSKMPHYRLRFPSLRKSKRRLVNSLILDWVFLDRDFGQVLQRRKRKFTGPGTSFV